MPLNQIAIRSLHPVLITTAACPQPCVTLCLYLASALACPGQIVILPRTVVANGPSDSPPNEPAVAVDLSNPSAPKLVCDFQLMGPQARRVGYSVSTNGGASWQEKDSQGQQRVLPLPNPKDPDFNCLQNFCDPPTGNMADPGVTFDPVTGEFWATGLADCDGPRTFVNRMPPGASDFTQVSSFLSADPDSGKEPDPNCLNHYQQILTAAPEGAASRLLVISVTLPHFDPGCPQRKLKINRRVAGVWTCRQALLANGQPVLGDYPRGAASIGGTVYIVYEILPAPRQLAVIKSTDNGSTFGAPAIIPGTTLTPDHAAQVAGPMIIDPPAKSVAMHPNDPNFLAVVYANIQDPNAGPDLDVDVFCVVTTNGGQSWSQPIRVNNDIPNPQNDQFHPAVVIDRQGRIHVFFYDTRDHPAPNTAPHALIGFYYARSTNGGQSFTNHRIHDQAINTAYLTPSTQYKFHDYNWAVLSRDPVDPAKDMPGVVYMGTKHFIAEFGEGEGDGIEGEDPDPLQTEETIFWNGVRQLD